MDVLPENVEGWGVGVGRKEENQDDGYMMPFKKVVCLSLAMKWHAGMPFFPLQHQIQATFHTMDIQNAKAQPLHKRFFDSILVHEVR